MLIVRSAAVFVLAAACVLPVATIAQSNTDLTSQTKDQLKQDRKASKAQAHADKKQRKALDTHAQKEADKAQDKADRKAADAQPHY